MNLWRLEWLRLVRTRRIVALAGVYLFFGVTSPLLARYTNELLERFGAGVQIVAPEPAPLDGFTTYVSNANQLGLLVTALVVSAAVAFDAQREMAVFLRTRVPRHRDLLVPRYTVSVAAGCAAYVLGALATWYGTTLLLGSVDPAGVLAGALLSASYLAFTGSVAAVVGARLGSVMTTTATTIAVVALLGLAGSLPTAGDWLPNHLLGALTDLVAGGDLTDYLPSLAVTAAASLGLLALAVRWGGHREV